MEPLTREEIKAYLSRLGISEIQEPTKAFLFELHRAHVRVFLGKPLMFLQVNPQEFNSINPSRSLSMAEADIVFI